MYPGKYISLLKPDAIILLTEKAQTIAQRRKSRDGIDHNIADIELFQNEELRYAKEIAALLSIQIHISPGTKGLNEALLFVDTTMRRLENGR